MRARAGAMLLLPLLCIEADGSGVRRWAAPREPAGAAAAGARCSRVVVEGEVRSGQGFRRAFGGGLDFVLEPIAAGWVIRVLPSVGSRPAEDFAEMATPPYRSVSPLLVSTDFGFRAQDAVGWNPRRFRYARNARAFGLMETVYTRVTASARPLASDETVLGELAGAAPEGVFEILDASLAPGTADQSGAAALVAVHFGTTAHHVEQPEGGKATALGKIGALRFRARMELPRGVRPADGLRVESYSCGSENTGFKGTASKNVAPRR